MFGRIVCRTIAASDLKETTDDCQIKKTVELEQGIASYGLNLCNLFYHRVAYGSLPERAVFRFCRFMLYYEWKEREKRLKKNLQPLGIP